MTIVFKRPIDGEPNYKVAVTGSGTRGVICARVAAFMGATPATAVYGKVYDLAGTIPQNHDMADPPVESAVAEANKVWYFASLPNAEAGATNVLAVWAVFNGSGPDELETAQFGGVAATKVECALKAGESGDSEGAGQPLTAKAGGGGCATALSLVPLGWYLLADGFEVARSAFNGGWPLNLRGTSGGYCVWDNGGDGDSAPHVELRCESPLVSTWRLTFRDGTGSVVEYTRPAAEWNSLAANVLHRTGDAGPAPDRLTITPA